MLSLQDYKSLEETSYLLRSPKNARRLIESIAELERGGGSVAVAVSRAGGAIQRMVQSPGRLDSG